MRDALSVIEMIYGIAKKKCTYKPLNKIFIKYNYDIEQLLVYAKLVKKYVDNNITITNISTYVNLLKYSKVEGMLVTYNCNISEVIEKLCKNKHHLHRILSYTKFYLNYV